MLNLKTIFGTDQNVSVALSVENCQVRKAGIEQLVRFVILLMYYLILDYFI